MLVQSMIKSQIVISTFTVPAYHRRIGTGNTNISVCILWDIDRTAFFILCEGAELAQLVL